MTDYKPLVGEWQEMLSRRRAMGDALSFWTPVLEGWRDWDDRGLAPLGWTGEECRQRWARGVPLLADAAPAVSPEWLEDLIGPLMERLAVGSPAAAEALARFAAAWDEGTVGPTALFPTRGAGGAAAVEDEPRLPGHLVSFLAHAGLRPALEVWFSRVRTLPASGWEGGFCPWCGGMPSYGDLMEDGRRRLSCHLCGGAWSAPRLRCPFCRAGLSSDMVRLVAEGAEEGYFIEACLVCRGYLKGLDRRERWNGASPLVEDWASPHLDFYAARDGYRRATPSLAQLLPEGGEEGAR